MDFVEYVQQELKVLLTKYTITDVPEEETQAAQIVIGNLFDDKERITPCIEVYHDPDKGSEINDEAAEIPMSTGWHHWFKVKASYFMTRQGKTRDLARAEAMTFFERITKAILENAAMTFNSADEQGYGNELALRKRVFREKGGPPTSWIWEAEYDIRIQTLRP